MGTTACSKKILKTRYKKTKGFLSPLVPRFSLFRSFTGKNPGGGKVYYIFHRPYPYCVWEYNKAVSWHPYCVSRRPYCSGANNKEDWNEEDTCSSSCFVFVLSRRHVVTFCYNELEMCVLCAWQQCDNKINGEIHCHALKQLYISVFTS